MFLGLSLSLHQRTAGGAQIIFLLLDEDGNVLVDEDGNVLVDQVNGVAQFGPLTIGSVLSINVAGVLGGSDNIVVTGAFPSGISLSSGLVGGTVTAPTGTGAATLTRAGRSIRMDWTVSYAAGQEPLPDPEGPVVSTVAEIMAIASGTVTVPAGEVVEVVPGFYDFSATAFYNKFRNLANKVHFRGYGGRPVWSELVMQGATPSEIGNVEIEGIDFYRPQTPANWIPADPSYGSTIVTIEAHDVTLRDVWIRSDMGMAGRGVFPKEDIRAIRVMGNSNNVQILGGGVENTFYAYRLAGTDITLKGATVRHVSADGVNPLSPATNMLIENVHVENFVTDSTAIHPDIVQFQAPGTYSGVTVRGCTGLIADSTKMRPGADTSSRGSLALTGNTTLNLATHANRLLSSNDGLTHTLPAASSCPGETFLIRVPSGSCTVNSTGGDTDADLTFPYAVSSALTFNCQTFRSNGTGWERIQPGLRAANMVFEDDVTVAEWHRGGRILADTSAGPVTVTLPDVADGFVIQVGLYTSEANAVTVVPPSGEQIDFYGTQNDTTVISTFFGQRRFLRAGGVWLELAGSTYTQGIFANDYTFENITFEYNVLGISGTWASRLMNPVTGGFNIRHNAFLRPLPPDLDGDGVLTAADGYQPFETGIVEVRGAGTVVNNIVGGLVRDVGDGVGMMIANNIELGHGFGDEGDVTKYAARLAGQTLADYYPQNRAELVAMVQTKAGENPYIGPTEVWDFSTGAKRTDIPAPALTGTVPADAATDVALDGAITITADQPLASASLTLSVVGGSSVAATVTVQGLTATVTPDAGLSNGEDYEVTGTLTSIHGGTVAVDTSFETVAAPAGITGITALRSTLFRQIGGGAVRTVTTDVAATGTDPVYVLVSTRDAAGVLDMSATLNGVAMEQLVDFQMPFKDFHCAAFRADAANVPAGTFDVVVTADAGSYNGSAIYVGEANGAADDQTGALTATAGTGSGGQTSIGVGMTPAAGSYVLACSMHEAAATGVTGADVVIDPGTTNSGNSVTYAAFAQIGPADGSAETITFAHGAAAGTGAIAIEILA